MSTATSDWKARAAAKKASQAQQIPAEYLSDLSSLGVSPLPEEPVPRPSDPAAPWRPLPTTLYKDESVIDVPRKILSMEEVAITSTPLDKLLALLSSGQLSSVVATKAFLKRAILAHQLTNCLTEVMVPYALERAAACDAHLAKTGKTIGPLHGLPVSLKDQFNLDGFETTMGYVGWIGKIAKGNSVITEVILRGQ